MKNKIIYFMCFLLLVFVPVVAVSKNIKKKEVKNIAKDFTLESEVLGDPELTNKNKIRVTCLQKEALRQRSAELKTKQWQPVKLPIVKNKNRRFSGAWANNQMRSNQRDLSKRGKK